MIPRNMTRYREAQKRALVLLADLSTSVCMGFTLQGQKQCLSLAHRLKEMQDALGVEGPQCLPAAQEEKK